MTPSAPPPALRTRVEHLAYEARRMGQARQAFVNWPDLLTRMLAEKVGRGSGDLLFRTRDGLLVTTPNVPGARLPLFEQFAVDTYGLDALLAPYADGPLSVLDIGSHIGCFALNVAHRHRGATVHSYEPSPDSARYLRRNVEQNALADRITVHQVAVSDREGTATLDDNAGSSVHNGLTHSGDRLVAGEEARAERRGVDVPTVTFDAAVAAAAAPPDLVKLDCEGSEYAMVYASTPASWASVTTVVMEYHPVAGQSWEALAGWLAEVGLQVVRHEPIAPGLGTAWLSRTPPG